jgi:hypothetical protein
LRDVFEAVVHLARKKGLVGGKGKNRGYILRANPRSRWCFSANERRRAGPVHRRTLVVVGAFIIRRGAPSVSRDQSPTERVSILSTSRARPVSPARRRREWDFDPFFIRERRAPGLDGAGTNVEMFETHVAAGSQRPPRIASMPSRLR